MTGSDIATLLVRQLRLSLSAYVSVAGRRDFRWTGVLFVKRPPQATRCASTTSVRLKNPKLVQYFLRLPLLDSRFIAARQVVQKCNNIKVLISAVDDLDYFVSDSFAMN